MAPSLDGERARQLANTLLGAKDGGHHHPKRTSALTSLRCQIRCCALATTIPWLYELIDRQLATENVAQAQRRLVRRKLVNTTARSWRCRPPSLAPNSVLVSRSARSLSSLGAIGEKNTRDPILVKSQRVNEINESTIQGEWSIRNLKSYEWRYDMAIWVQYVDSDKPSYKFQTYDNRWNKV